MSDVQATRCFLRKVYDVSYVSDLHSPRLSDELPGRGGTTLTESRLELALVKSTIKRSLKWDCWISTIDAIFSDSPEALYDLVALLSRTTKCGRGKALMVIENYKFSSHDGLVDVHSENSIERTLNGWMEISLEVLTEEFQEKGWI